MNFLSVPVLFILVTVSPGRAEADLNDIFWPGPHVAAQVASKIFSVSFCRLTPSRARCGISASKLLRFHSRVDKVAVRVALGRTIVPITWISNVLNEKLKHLALPLSLQN